MSHSPVELRAGPLSVVYLDGDLRYISVAGREVVRRIYPTVRDSTWGTLLPIERNTRIDRSSTGFTIVYEADFRQDNIDLTGKIRMNARAVGTTIFISYIFFAIAKSTFQTNRTGVCLLHPIDALRGRPCRVCHADGSFQSTPFPDKIAPHAPFTDIAAMQYCVDGIDTTIRFTGERFETEDQRNWCDTSFKTYCRPSKMPRPYTIRAGERIEQGIAIKLDLADEKPTPDQQELRVGNVIYPMPRLGTVINAVPGPAALDAIRRLPISFIRHDARPTQGDWLERLGQVAALGWPIELAMHVDCESQLPPLKALPEKVQGIAIFRDRKPCTDLPLINAACRRYSRLALTGGTIGNFGELNRNRPTVGMLNSLNYGICPQIHAMDDLSIMENLAAQSDTVNTARGFAAGALISAGPITLNRRPDPFAAGNDGRVLEAPIDPRHATEFGAAWTVGSLKHLFESGAAAAVYYQAAGPHGLVWNDGTPLPLYHIFANLAEFIDGDVLEVNDPQPLQYKALAVGENGRIKLILANVGWRPVTVPIAGHGSVTLPVHGTHTLHWKVT